ncbi:MAG: sigma-70 family RNA polymerase sigma factor [Candidatus Puniceispirillales bacterium]
MRTGLAGDREAYREFFRAVVPMLTRMIASMAPALPVDQREDIVQDILTTVHAKRHTWQQTKPILPWLYAIARHRLIDHLRRQQRGAATFHDIDLDSIAEITAGPDHNPDLKIDLEKGIDQLEGRAGTVVRAIGLDGKDIRQTSNETGISENAVRIAFHRGLKKLRVLFTSPPEKR